MKYAFPKIIMTNVIEQRLALKYTKFALNINKKGYKFLSSMQCNEKLSQSQFGNHVCKYYKSEKRKKLLTYEVLEYHCSIIYYHWMIHMLLYY